MVVMMAQATVEAMTAEATMEAMDEVVMVVVDM